MNNRTEHDIKIRRDPDGKLYLTVQYRLAFAEAAKHLGGNWQCPYWVFDDSLEPAVQALCQMHYGRDWTAAADAADEQQTLSEVALRLVVSDGNCRLSGVLAMSPAVGGLAGSADPAQQDPGQGVVMVYGVPHGMAQELAQTPAPWLRDILLLNDALPVDETALQIERAALLARLGQINRTLAGSSSQML